MCRCGRRPRCPTDLEPARLRFMIHSLTLYLAFRVEILYTINIRRLSREIQEEELKEIKVRHTDFQVCLLYLRLDFRKKRHTDVEKLLISVFAGVLKNKFERKLIGTHCKFIELQLVEDSLFCNSLEFPFRYERTQFAQEKLYCAIKKIL